MARSIRVVALWAAAAIGVSWGQAPAESLSVLQESAERRTTDWDGLARTLEGRVARMLPCDARVRTAIDEVNRASDARLAAVSQYWQALAAQSRVDAQKTAQALADLEASVREMETEAAEADQERIAVDAQLADLSESLKRRPGLANTQRSLAAIIALIGERGSTVQQQAARRTALAGALRELVTAQQTAERAIQAEIAALAAESSRWTEYYTARIARAQTECSITNPAASRPAQRKKQ